MVVQMKKLAILYSLLAVACGLLFWRLLALYDVVNVQSSIILKHSVILKHFDKHIHGWTGKVDTAVYDSAIMDSLRSGKIERVEE